MCLTESLHMAGKHVSILSTPIKMLCELLQCFNLSCARQVPAKQRAVAAAGSAEAYMLPVNVDVLLL